LLDSVEQLVAVVADQTAQRILLELKLKPIAIFSELNGEHLPKLKGFLDIRLPRLFLD
jgi:hypothetical protein